MISKKIKLLGLLFVSTIAISFTSQAAMAAGSSGWVTYSVGAAYCKQVPYGPYGTKPFTFQNLYQKRTNVNNAGVVSYSYRTVTQNLGAGCR